MTYPRPNPLGGTGDPPVPVGDPPTGTSEDLPPSDAVLLQKCCPPSSASAEHQLVPVRKHLPDVLDRPPISQVVNVAEIIGQFGGANQHRNAVNHLQTLLHAA